MWSGTKNLSLFNNQILKNCLISKNPTYKKPSDKKDNPINPSSANV